MKSIYPVVVTALLVATGAGRAVADEVVFIGVFSTSSSTLVAIAQNSDAPRWVKVGERVGAYTVKSFDPEKETVALQKADGVIELKLKVSKVRPVATMELVESLASLGVGKFPYLIKAYRESENTIARSKAYLAEYEKGEADQKKLSQMRESIEALELAKGKLWEKMAESAAEIGGPPNRPTVPTTISNVGKK